MGAPPRAAAAPALPGPRFSHPSRKPGCTKGEPFQGGDLAELWAAAPGLPSLVPKVTARPAGPREPLPRQAPPRWAAPARRPPPRPLIGRAAGSPAPSRRKPRARVRGWRRRPEERRRAGGSAGGRPGQGGTPGAPGGRPGPPQGRGRAQPRGRAGRSRLSRKASGLSPAGAGGSWGCAAGGRAGGRAPRTPSRSALRPDDSEPSSRRRVRCRAGGTRAGGAAPRRVGAGARAAEPQCRGHGGQAGGGGEPWGAAGEGQGALLAEGEADAPERNRVGPWDGRGAGARGQGCRAGVCGDAGRGVRAGRLPSPPARPVAAQPPPAPAGPLQPPPAPVLF